MPFCTHLHFTVADYCAYCQSDLIFADRRSLEILDAFAYTCPIAFRVDYAFRRAEEGVHPLWSPHHLGYGFNLGKYLPTEQRNSLYQHALRFPHFTRVAPSYAASRCVHVETTASQFVLRPGILGPEILVLQDALRQVDGVGCAISGCFDQQTLHAVRRFQLQAGLIPQDHADQNVRFALQEQLTLPR